MKDPIEMIKKARDIGIPTFTIKATDKHAQQIMTQYTMLLISDVDCTAEFTNEIVNIQKHFAVWAHNHPDEIKSPD